jgi:1-deoxy-D-xylulose-5-phosphate synthase
MNAETPLLDTVNSPAEVRALDRRQLKQLAQELRQFLLNSVSATGGHLSSNLGTVELTTAIHHVFNLPYDRLVWDVGHQSYPHKVLTGRKNQMPTLRQLNGLSGFPKRSESEFDAFGTAHSSTSISAALGMAVASKHKGEHIGPDRRRHIAVIGDGALSGGMAFEALNNGGLDTELDLLVILNDNDMSISKPVGALSNYLTRLLSGRFYRSAREISKTVLGAIPPVLEFAKRFEGHAKGMLMPSTLFEELGFNYVGPIDGHDLDALVPALLNLRELKGPHFLHVITRKGQGYLQAESDPILYHGPGKFDPAVGITSKAASKPTYSQVFGNWLCDAAESDPRVIAVTPAMCEGSGMQEFAQRFASRYFDVGIAEQHAVTFAAGIACEGQRPVLAIYSTFLQRGYDQLIHDVALQNLPVLFAIDRAGLVGADGATHAGIYDYAYMRCVPNMVIMAPKDEIECRRMLSTGLVINGPSAVRYPRGAGTGVDAGKTLEPLPVGKAELVREIKKAASAGKPRIAILAFGSMVSPAIAAGDALDATVVNMRFVKPIDLDMIKHIANSHDLIVTVEEHVIMGGAGSACAEALVELGDAIPMVPIFHLGLPDRFIDHGDHATLLSMEGLDAKGIEKSIRERLGSVSHIKADLKAVS